MHDIKANLYPCAHCAGVGTCKNGMNDSTCSVCIKEHEVKGKEHVGLPCAVCGGLGLAEPKTERLNKRVTPVLGLLVVLFLIGLIFIATLIKSPHFSEILVFAGTMIGTVLGFYFSAKSKSG